MTNLNNPAYASIPCHPPTHTETHTRDKKGKLMIPVIECEIKADSNHMFHFELPL